MTEIEKMFENAGIKKCNRLLPCPFKNECEEGCEYHWYPDFDAEKQLELIKWLIKLNCLELWYFGSQKKAFDFDLGEINAKGATFEESLAGLINDLWQDLTDKEKEEIRNILNAFKRRNNLH